MTATLWALFVLGLLSYVAVAFFVGVVVGRAIRRADEIEGTTDRDDPS